MKNQTEDKYYQLTAEALEDVKFGRTVDHAEVEEWAMSLSTHQPKPAPKYRSRKIR